MTSDNEYLLRKISLLSRALIASGLINIVVLGLFSYWTTRERPPTPYCELKPKKQTSVISLLNPPGLNESLAQLSKLSFSQLIELLQSRRPMSQIYLEKDLALTSLVTFHYFDLARALKPGDLPQQKHLVKLTKNGEETIVLTIYPDLTSKELQAIIHFASTEHWPLTAEGLFSMLKKQAGDKDIDNTLIEAFALTPEFWSIELLLSRADQSITRDQMVHLLAEGNWEILKKIANQQSKLNDLSDARRRQVLLEYVHLRSKNAAELLLKLDWEFTLKKMNDQEILAILQVLNRKSNESERFAKELLASPRSVRVWQKAAVCLYGYAGEEIPSNWDYQRTIARFVYPSPSQQKLSFPAAPLLAKTTIKKTTVPLSLASEKSKLSLPSTPLKVAPPIIPASKSAPVILYTVQPGDSLWKISRKFNVGINKIKEVNKLSSDTLKPGTILKIPS